MTELPTGVSLIVGNQPWPEVEDLVTTTESPGGLKECRFSLPSIQGSQIRWDDPLIIYDSVNQRWPFVGRISSVHKTGICFDFIATRSTRLQTMVSTPGNTSPSHPSGEYAGKIYKSGTPMAQALTDALQLCEAVFDGGINQLTGYQFIGDSSNVGGYTPEQMWDYISGLLAGFSTPLLWHIRGSGGVQLVVIDFQDPAARYRVQLDETQIDETYDSEQVITKAAVEWGNDQIYSQQLLHPSVAGRSLIHNKYVNGTRDLARLGDAQGLVGTYLARFGQFVSSTTTLTLECDKDTVTVVEPVGSSDDWPLRLIESGHGIALLNRPVELAPYNESLKYIIGTEYVWKSGKLTAQCGTAGGGLDGRIQATVDYNVNRMFFGPYNGPPGGSHPLADADLIPLVGSEISGAIPPSTSYGVPGFKAAVTDGDPNVPYDKQLDPDLVPDEGLEANVNFDPSAEGLGFQAAIRTTPGTYDSYRILLGNAAGLIADTVVAKFYRIIPPAESAAGGTQFLCQVESIGLKDRTAVIAPPCVLKRGDYMMIELITAGSVATWAAVSLHAKKNFPRLKS